MKKLRTHIYNGNMPESDGDINILVSGFQQQRIVSVQQVVEALDPIPRSHMENLHVIKYDPERTVQQAMSEAMNQQADESVVGVYYDMKTPGVVIHRFENQVEFYKLLYHELGHYVYFRILDQDLKVKWVNEIYPSSNQFVSHYATLNACEDFAECYSYFCVFPHVLWKIPEKMKFMAEEVFYLAPGSYNFSRVEPYDGVSPAMPDIE